MFITDRPGALYAVLEPLARRGISMNRIESRPAHSGLWQYAFFIDVGGHVGESPLRDALAELGGSAGGGHVLVCEAGSQRVRLAYDVLLVAVGRKPRTTGFGLEELGIPSAHTVETDAYLATLYPNIHACGDVAGPYQFTHVAAHQAWYATVNALFGQFHRFRVDYSVIPAVTFVDPEVARVGLNEREAKEQDIAF